MAATELVGKINRKLKNLALSIRLKTIFLLGFPHRIMVPATGRFRLAGCLFICLSLALLPGCASKSKSRAKARAYSKKEAYARDKARAKVRAGSHSREKNRIKGRTSTGDKYKKIQIPEKFKNVKIKKPLAELGMPDFVPVGENISPLNTRLVNISARNSLLRDVLFVIAEASSLNLVMERGVAPDTPVTMALKDITVLDALTTVCKAVDCFYEVKGNMLIIKAVATKIFELGHPAITQTYSTSVGGDILSGAAAITGAGSNITGNISQEVASDKTAFDFWDAIEKSISNILGIPLDSPGSQASLRGANGVGSQARQTPATVSTATQTAVVNRMTGTIFVTATKNNLERVEKYINEIKRIISRQVIIEARIIEVQLSDNLKYGIDWGFMGSSDSAAGSVSQTGFSSVINTAVSPAMNIRAIFKDFNFFINGLQKQGEVRTLSNPRVTIMNGQTSLLSVGRAENFVSSVTTTTSGVGAGAGITTFTVETGNVLSGLMIGIVPYINREGEVSMTITPIISDLVKLEQVSVGGGTISLPTVDLRELSTTVKVRNGEMVIIGGLISEKEDLIENKAPFLSKIPIIKNLFKNVDKTKTRSELVVLLRPTITSM